MVPAALPYVDFISSFGFNKTTETTGHRANAVTVLHQVVRTAHTTFKAIYPLEGTTIR